MGAAPLLVEPYRLHRSYTPVLARVQAIADQAASLVSRRMRERLPHVTVQVSGERLLGLAVTEAQQQLLGTDRLPTSGCQGRDVYGVTTLGPHGAVVVINGARSRTAATSTGPSSTSSSTPCRSTGPAASSIG